MAIIFNDNIDNRSPKALDDRQGVFASGVWRPYNSLLEANTAIVYRHKTLTVSVVIAGQIKEYWYKDGITDGDLVEKYPPSSSTILSGLTNRLAYYPADGTLINDLAAITPNMALISDANGLPTHSVTTAIELGHVDGVTAPIQTQLDGKQATLVSATNIKTINSTSLLGSGDLTLPVLTDGDKGDITLTSSGTVWTIDALAVTNAKVATGIDATKLADGTVTNSEFQFINTLTSNAQTQIDSKQATLVSGTTIKTVNSVSLLGSGNVAVQDVLVSGTSIKTVNSTSLLGSGNIVVSAALTVQNHTSGATVTVSGSNHWLVVNPASLLASLTVTMPPSPADSETVEISFGGTITSGDVVTSLTVSPNSGQTLLQATTPSNVEAGETIMYRYKSSNTKWYRIL